MKMNAMIKAIGVACLVVVSMGASVSLHASEVNWSLVQWVQNMLPQSGEVRDPQTNGHAVAEQVDSGPTRDPQNP